MEARYDQNAVERAGVISYWNEDYNVGFANWIEADVQGHFEHASDEDVEEFVRGLRAFTLALER
jgi:hypothetical protein